MKQKGKKNSFRSSTARLLKFKNGKGRSKNSSSSRDTCSRAKNFGKKVFLVLNDVRSLYNVGAIFRTAEAAGVKKIFLCGITGYPKIGPEWRQTAQIVKTALGAEKVVPWKYHHEIIPLLKSLRKQGIKLVALEQTEQSIDFRKAKYKFPLALILGHKREGINKKVLRLAHQVIEIPMYGEIKESLNVAVAGGIALYEIIS